MRSAVVALVTLASACRDGSAPPPARSELRILLPADILSPDPNRDVETVTESVLFNVYEPLVGIDASLGVRPMLAESWEHPAPERWRFHLRRGVRFHDGTPLSAPIVRDALLALRSSAQREAAEMLTTVREVGVVDDMTVDLVTTTPRALLLSLPSVYIARPAAAAAFPPWIGTGPYELAEWRKGQRIVLRRARSYWGAPAHYDRVVSEPVVDAQARLERLQAAGADIIYDVPPEAVAEPCRGCHFARHDGATLYYLVPNTRRRPWSDPRVRRAVHLAVDRERLVERLHGTARPAYQAAPPNVFGFDPAQARPPRDPAAARRLLAAAGYPRGFATSLDVFTARAPLAESIRQDLAEIGIAVAVNAVERGVVYDLARGGDRGLSFVGWVFSSGESGEFLEYCLHTRDAERGFNNFGGWSNSRIDAIAEANATLLEADERLKVLQEAGRLVVDELPIIPLYTPQDVYGVRDGVGFSPRADGEIWLPDVRPAAGNR